MSPPPPSPAMDGAASPASTAIFVVDDDLALVDSLTDLLADEGYHVEAFTQPLEALARLQAGARPRVLLLDYMMPEMTGEEFLAALASAGVEVPVLLLSGVSDPPLRGDVAGVIMKPFDIDRLLGALDRLIGGARG